MKRLLSGIAAVLAAMLLTVSGQTPPLRGSEAPLLPESGVTVRRQTHFCINRAQTVELLTQELPPGEKRVLCAGSDAVTAITECVLLRNGVEYSRTQEQLRTLCRKADRVVLVGAPDNARVQDRIAASRSIRTEDGKTLQYREKLRCIATAYSCEGRQGITAIGTTARVGAIAVDPAVIPYGTRMYIVSEDGEYVYGLATAEDCGNFRGYQIDLYFDTVDECWQFGSRSCTVYILD